MGLGIGGAELIGKKIADDFSKCFLCKELIKFFKC